MIEYFHLIRINNLCIKCIVEDVDRKEAELAFIRVYLSRKRNKEVKSVKRALVFVVSQV